MLSSLIGLILGAVGLINRLLDIFNRRQQEQAILDDIEREAKIEAEEKLIKLRIALDAPFGLDGLPDDFFADETVNINLTVHIPDGNKQPVE